MGLPLYRAPAESSVKPKPPTDPPTRARSTIRRATTRRPHDSALTPSARFYSRRQNHPAPGAAETPSPWNHFVSGDTAPPRSDALPRNALRRAATLPDAAAVPPLDSARPARPADSTVREVGSRNGMSQDMARHFGEHMAMLHAATSSRQPPETPSEGDETEPTNTDRWASAARDRPIRARQLVPPSWSYPRQAESSGSARPVDGSTQQPSQPPVRLSDVILRHSEEAWRRMTAGRASRTPAPLGDASQPPRPQAQPAVDGLGDRTRSLSPEDEGVWDTLLSSITPDPQPPSVGSSFASTSAPASGSTSQESAPSASSSHTTNTAATISQVLGIDYEHPCESGGDNSDTEGEEDDLSQLELRRFGRSYADVTRTQREDDDLEIMGGVESMQRIVRNLARREDIPDEWWADAGLSRSLQMRREAA